MEQPLPQCLLTNSVPRAFFTRVAIGCRLSLKTDRNLWDRIRGYMIWYGVNRRYGIWIEYLYRSVLYHSLMTKLSTPPYLKVNKRFYFTYLFTALSHNACTSHEFMTLRNCWTLGTAFSRLQSIAHLMESASSRQRRTFWAMLLC